MYLVRSFGNPYIIECMAWISGGLVLLLVGVLLRYLLRLDAPPARPSSGLLPLSPEREAIYQPISMELETQCAILGISLNDAIDERNSGHHEIAWRLVCLVAGEWDRVEEILSGLLGTVAKHMVHAHVAVPARSMAAQRFKSPTMTDYFRMHELLDQLVFRSKMRFQLQVRVLRRAAATLTGEFRRTYRYAERTEDRPPEFWSRLDLFFHDLDLLSKETLLAFRMFLVCLPDAALAGFAADLQPVLRRRERAASIQADA